MLVEALRYMLVHTTECPSQMLCWRLCLVMSSVRLVFFAYRMARWLLSRRSNHARVVKRFPSIGVPRMTRHTIFVAEGEGWETDECLLMLQRAGEATMTATATMSRRARRFGTRGGRRPVRAARRVGSSVRQVWLPVSCDAECEWLNVARAPHARLGWQCPRVAAVPPKVFVSLSPRQDGGAAHVIQVIHVSGVCQASLDGGAAHVIFASL